MIDGYAFADGSRKSLVVIDDVVTKQDLIEWGWALGPVPISGEPTPPPNPKAIPPHRGFYTRKYIDGLLASHLAMELDGSYYLIGGSGSPAGVVVEKNEGMNDYGEIVLPTQPFKRSPWEKWFWKYDRWKEENSDVINTSDFKAYNFLVPQVTNASNPTAIDLILAGLSSPIDTDGLEPIVYHTEWVLDAGVLGGGERREMTIWWYRYGPDGGDSFLDRMVVPGVDYFRSAKLRYEKLPPNMSEPREVGVAVNFPHCEIGPNFCVYFKVQTNRRLYYDHADKHIIWATLAADFISYPEKIRRIPMPRFQPRTTTNTVSCYVLNRQEEMKFVERISNKTISDQVKGFLYGDGAGAILSLKWFFGVRPAIPTTQKRKITLGNYIINDLSVPVFAGDFVQVYMGSVFVRGPFEDYRNYTDARYQMFIPMLGHVDLDPSRVVGKNVHLIYTVNLTDGSAVVTVATTEVTEELAKKDGWYETMNNIFTSSITYGYEIPLNVDSIKDVSARVGEVTVKAVAGGAAGAIAGNVPGALLGAAAGVASATNPVQTTYSSGSLTPNSNVMGDFTPKIYVKFNKGTAGDLSPAIGYPCGKIVKIGDASGYLKAAVVYGTPSTTMQHADEIENMLKEGIRIS